MVEPEDTTGGAAGPVLLALSTFRRSERAVDLAIEKALEAGAALHVLNVVDVNLARYFIGTDIGLYPELQEKAEHEILALHGAQGQAHVEAIAEKARAQGLAVETHIRMGRFALVALELAAELRPALIVTTRSRRPDWVKRVFGSPVTHLVQHAPCPVVET